MSRSLMFLSVPGLRPMDLSDPSVTPTLCKLAREGASRSLRPSFPCVTSPVQASMLTGTGPGAHGVIANGFYHRDRKEVEFWVAHHDILDRPSFFAKLAQSRPDVTSAVFHAQNIKGADATYIITPSPIHEADGTTKLWCYSKPDGLYERMLEPLGHFPLQHYWGPLSNIESTKWIVKASLWMHEHHAPMFQYVYLPHLDYAAQKFGPNAPQSQAALIEFDSVLAGFIERYRQLPGGENADWVVAGEYALTDVVGAIHPNRLLRDAGLLRVREESGSELLDIPACKAFAMVDHQFAHVYVDGGDVEAAAEVFRRVRGVADVLAGDERAKPGIDHPRSGQIVLISEPDHWFTYYWWKDDSAAPPFARTVDIHAKPGYDPVELFVDMPSRKIPLDASLVKGSHGAPVYTDAQKSVLISSRTDLLERLPEEPVDQDVYGLLANAFEV